MIDIVTVVLVEVIIDVVAKLIKKKVVPHKIFLKLRYRIYHFYLPVLDGIVVNTVDATLDLTETELLVLFVDVGSS